MLRTAQNHTGRAQGRSEPLRLALWARPGPLRAAQSRSESLRARPEPLRARPEPSPRAVRAAQRRSESLGACPEPLRAAQSRPERSLGAVRGTAQGRTERAQSCSAPLRIARCVPRAAQSRSESPRAVGQSCSKKTIGELGVTCTLHIKCSVLLDMVLSSPCMYMHGFTLVYIHIYIYIFIICTLSRKS